MGGVGPGQREGTVTPRGEVQTLDSSSLMAEGGPIPSIPGYLRAEGGQSAFAITTSERTSGFVPIRDSPDDPQGPVASQARPVQRLNRTAVAQPRIDD